MERVLLAPGETAQVTESYGKTYITGSARYLEQVETATATVETPKQEVVAEDSEIKDLRKQYEEKHGKKVSNFKKNNAEWIKSQL